MNDTQLALVQKFILQHPSTVARQAEAAPSSEVAELMIEIGPRSAADLLDKMVPLAAALALSDVLPEYAADVVEHMDPRHIAPLLRRLETKKAAAILAELTAEKRPQVERLMSYERDQVASRMDPRAPAALSSMTAEQALRCVRQAADGALSYIYVLSDERKLVGVLSMRRLLLMDPSDLIADVMTVKPTVVFGDEPLKTLPSNPGWRLVHALPVVDRHGQFLGVIRYLTFRALETELGRTKTGSSTHASAGALAELFWVGTSAMARLAETVVLGDEALQKKESP